MEPAARGRGFEGALAFFSDLELPAVQGQIQSWDPLEVGGRGVELPGRGKPVGLPMGRGVWPQDGGEVSQGIISALSGTHQTSPSS